LYNDSTKRILLSMCINDKISQYEQNEIKNINGSLSTFKLQP
jgi:hypothetical protein